MGLLSVALARVIHHCISMALRLYRLLLCLAVLQLVRGKFYVCQHELFGEEFRNAVDYLGDKNAVLEAVKKAVRKHIQHVYVMFDAEDNTQPPQAVWLTAKNQDELMDKAKGELVEFVTRVDDFDEKDKQALSKAREQAIEIAKKVEGPGEIKQESVAEMEVGDDAKCYAMDKTKCNSVADIAEVIKQHGAQNYNAWKHNCIDFGCAVMAYCGESHLKSCEYPAQCKDWFLGFSHQGVDATHLGLQDHQLKSIIGARQKQAKKIEENVKHKTVEEKPVEKKTVEASKTENNEQSKQQSYGFGLWSLQQDQGKPMDVALGNLKQDLNSLTT